VIFSIIIEGVPVRSARIRMERPVLQATQPKGEQIFQKDGCRNMPLKEASMQHPTSCVQNHLDTQEFA